MFIYFIGLYYLLACAREDVNMEDIDITGTVRSKGNYVINRTGRWSCNLGHFDINGKDLADIIEDFYGIKLDKGINLHIQISCVDEEGF